MDEDEMDPISHHVAVSVGKQILFFGGYSYGTHMNDVEYISHRTIYMYNLVTWEWCKHIMPDDQQVPHPVADACAAVIHNAVYMFGGFYGITESCDSIVAGEHKDNYCSNELWKLSKAEYTFKWTRVQVQTLPWPRRKASAWEFEGKFWVFGGSWTEQFEYPEEIYSNDAWHSDTFHDISYCNELLSFDSVHGWELVMCRGTIPSWRHGHASAKIEDKLFLHGGKFEYAAFDDLYELNMKTLTWTILEPCGPTKPVGRGCRTLTAYSNKYIVLHGGQIDSRHAMLADTWALDVSSLTWRKCATDTDSRSCHTATKAEGYGDLVVVGGMTKDLMGTVWNCTDIFNFSLFYNPKTLEDLALKAIQQNQHLLELREWNMPSGTWHRLQNM